MVGNLISVHVMAKLATCASHVHATKMDTSCYILIVAMDAQIKLSLLTVPCPVPLCMGALEVWRRCSCPRVKCTYLFMVKVESSSTLLSICVLSPDQHTYNTPLCSGRYRICEGGCIECG